MSSIVVQLCIVITDIKLSMPRQQLSTSGYSTTKKNDFTASHMVNE